MGCGDEEWALEHTPQLTCFVKRCMENVKSAQKKRRFYNVPPCTYPQSASNQLSANLFPSPSQPILPCPSPTFREIIWKQSLDTTVFSLQTFPARVARRPHFPNRNTINATVVPRYSQNRHLPKHGTSSQRRLHSQRGLPHVNGGFSSRVGATWI